MRKAILLILPVLALALSGCKTNDVIPPAEGIYSGCLSTTSVGCGTTANPGDTIFAIIDTNGVGMILDQTNAAIYRFTVPKPNENGDFSTSLTATFTGTGSVSSSVNIASNSTGGTITGTLNGVSNSLGSTSTQNTINGNITTATSGTQPYTLNYEIIANSGAALYTSNPLPLSTLLITPSNTIATPQSLSFTYTPAGTTSTTTVTLNNFAASTSVSGAYTFQGADTGYDACTYIGSFLMPNGGGDAYDISIQRSACTINGVSQSAATFNGLAEYNPPIGGSNATLSLEYDNSTDFAVYANASLAVTPTN